MNKKEESFMKIAEITSEFSKAIKMKVGCVIVKNGHIICQGYNGTLKKTDNECEIYDKDLGEFVTKIGVFHAEENAILQALNETISIKGSSIFVTHFPCLNCAKLIIGGKIKEVFYRNDYKDMSALKLFELANVKVIKI